MAMKPLMINKSPNTPKGDGRWMEGGWKVDEKWMEVWREDGCRRKEKNGREGRGGGYLYVETGE